MKTLMGIAFLAVAGSVIPSGLIRAQRPEPDVDSQVRVVMEDGREVRGEFRAWTEEGLSLFGPGDRGEPGWRTKRVRVMGLEEVQEVWLKTGKQFAVGRRMKKVGKLTVIAGLVGAVVGYVSWDESDRALLGPDRRSDWAGMYAATFATPMAIGGILWAVVGRDDVWTRITPAWQRQGGEAASDWTRDLHWSAGVTPDGQLAFGLTLRR